MAVRGELPETYAAIPLFAALTGLRPEEWISASPSRRDSISGATFVSVYTGRELP